MKKLAFVGLILMYLLSACDDDNDCPDDMEECPLQNGMEVCVPKGQC